MSVIVQDAQAPAPLAGAESSLPQLPLPELSLIVPMFNESGNIDRLFARLDEVMRGIGVPYEIVCVDDGSRDDTVDRVVAHHRRDERIKLVELSRNFGKELALTAGLHHCRGAAAVMIDADLQHPPELIADMVAQWRQGTEMVIAVRRDREAEGALARFNKQAFYWLFGKVSDIRLPPGAGDFRLLDRKIIDVLNAMPEHTRFMKGLYAWVGFRQVTLPFDVAPRAAGQSSFNLFRLWRLAIDGITSFTTVPLKVWTFLGMVAAVLGLLYGLVIIAKAILLGIDVPGYPSLMVATLFFGGIQLVSLGIIGEYLGRVFSEVKRRPLYVVRQAHGLDQRPVG